MSPPSSVPFTYPHPDAFTTLLPHLLPFLPSTLPLVRRLQFHASSSYAAALATYPPSLSPAETPPSFAACWFDRTRRPETECWIFSTYEIPHNTIDDDNNKDEKQEQQGDPRDEARAQLLALLLAIAATPTRHPSDHSPLIILGSVHSALLPLLAGDEPLPEAGGVVSRQPGSRCRKGDGSSVLSGVTSGYVKWVIPPSVSNRRKQECRVPQGYTFGKIEREELERVVSSTSIPRTEATLASLGNVCIRNDEGTVVSWGFLGVDRSLSSLYTEEGHRGKGLAKAVARRLVEQVGAECGQGEEGMKMGYRGIRDGEGWVHSDIDIGNKESAAVARAIGGREGWECRWISVDLERVREVVSQLDV